MYLKNGVVVLVEPYGTEFGKATELEGAYKLALEGTDARCLAREAAGIGLLLATGKIHRGRAVVRLQEISELLCSAGSAS